MIRTIAATASLLLLLLLPFPGSAGAKPSPAPDLIPAVPGTTWVYAGEQVAFDGEAQKEIRSAARSVVFLETVAQAKRAVALRFKGSWNAPLGAGESPAPLLVLVTADGYFTPFVEDPGKADPAALVRGLTDADLLFPKLLAVGKRFGEREMLKIHPPGRYSWLVESAFDFDRATVKGAGAGRAKGFRLVYHTNPDSQSIDIVPGIGVTRTTYEHHGTPASYVLTLTEIRRP